jgi:hypothetical protein
MRTLLAFIALLIASPAFAMSESELNFCKAMKDPMQCVNQFLTAEHKAMINGINQGFRPMPTPPPMVFQPMAMPYPNAGR